MRFPEIRGPTRRRDPLEELGGQSLGAEACRGLTNKHNKLIIT